jgi:ribosomal protein L37AE/L43A
MKSVERMSLEEIRVFHNTHLGSSKSFIWQCPHCGKRYTELMEQKANKLNEQRAHS